MYKGCNKLYRISVCKNCLIPPYLEALITNVQWFSDIIESNNNLIAILLHRDTTTLDWDIAKIFQADRLLYLYNIFYNNQKMYYMIGLHFEFSAYIQQSLFGVCRGGELG